jgi:hypothetical protein
MKDTHEDDKGFKVTDVGFSNSTHRPVLVEVVNLPKIILCMLRLTDGSSTTVFGSAQTGPGNE